MKKLIASGLGMAIASFLCAAQANAATITDNFSFTDVGGYGVVASGSFSYDSSSSGVLSFGDLDSFTINFLDGTSYDLADVNAITGPKYFGFDTVSTRFVQAAIPGSVDGFLTAIDGSLSNGFLAYIDGPGFTVANAASYFFRATEYSVSQVSSTPIPATLPLFASGLGGIGFLAYRRKKQAASHAA
jgi:hypothetical protein